MHRIFDKTDKGREEIATRRYRLAPRLRTLLLLIDGKQSTGQLLQKIAGLDEQSIADLLDGGFIQDIEDNVAEKLEAPLPKESSSDEPTDNSIVLAEGETKFEAIRKLYTATIRTTLGLRGYNFQLKVDEAQSVDDLSALHEPYIAAVLKAKGDAVARDLNQKLEQLFTLKDLPNG
jgi:hypothetical protein